MIQPLYWNWYRTRSGMFIRLLSDRLNMEVEDI